jgi:N-6 DNA Methylase
MRAAAAVLGAARSTDALIDVVRAAGIADPVADLDDDTRRALGLPSVQRARLAAGAGALRVIVVDLPPDASLRTEVQLLARRLSSRAPHVLWLAAVLDASRRSAAIAGWTGAGDAPRVVSFGWEPDHVADSDAETLCALSAVRATDVTAHWRYLEILGRDALTRRFYRALEREIQALSDSVNIRDESDARETSLLYASRLLFLRFLEAKGWLDGNREFLVTSFDDCMRHGGGFHDRVLLPLFFGTLNTPRGKRAPRARAFGRVPFLNGGLFSRTAVERRLASARFPDERLGALLENVFQPFRFVAREDTATWSEASVDPEMLGRAFESLMASRERRSTGVFYTPHALVSRVADAALQAAFDVPRIDRLAQVRQMRILDPACGSGAFLVHVLERLAARLGELGDARPTADVRRDVLARSIFGVDRNPTAVWLCELRLWLAVVVESDESDPLRVPPLPNLDRNIRVGDALIGGGFQCDALTFVGTARLTRLRERYTRATGNRKEQLARVLDREERKRALAGLERDIAHAAHARAECLASHRARDLFGERVPITAVSKRELRRLREDLRALRRDRRRLLDGGALPFSFGVSFADAQAAGGFDVVLGNPPWVRLHRIPAALRAQFKRTYAVFRDARWVAGAERARVAPGFASQVDLAALFTERAVALLRDGGVVSLLLPAKLWRSLAGGGLRTLLTERAQLRRLEDLSASPQAFDAAVYPSIMVAQTGETRSSAIHVAVHGRTDACDWRVERERLAYDDSIGAPWLLLPDAARTAFDRVRDVGVPLATSFAGAPRLGVKSGCNAAFLVRVQDVRGDVASVVDTNGDCGTVEAALLRPVLRGETVRPWQRAPCDEWIVWTHGADGAPLRELPPHARRWLRRHYTTLTTRSDAARSRRWWSLFRVDAAENDRARVVWADFGTRPRALVLRAGDPAVPLNTCYILHADEQDAFALAAVLNSRLAAAWLNAIAEPARGEYRRYLSWTVGQLPIPREWERVRLALAQARVAVESSPDSDKCLDDIVIRAYGLSASDLAPLLQWQP